MSLGRADSVFDLKFQVEGEIFVRLDHGKNDRNWTSAGRELKLDISMFRFREELFC